MPLSRELSEEEARAQGGEEAMCLAWFFRMGGRVLEEWAGPGGEEGGRGGGGDSQRERARREYLEDLIRVGVREVER